MNRININIKYIIGFLLLLVVLFMASYFYLDYKKDQEILNNFLEKDYLILYNDNNLAEAISMCHEYLEDNPKNTKLLVFLAIAYVQKGYLENEFNEGAIKGRNYIQAALDIDENNAEALRILGYTYELEGQPEKAIEIYKKAIDIDLGSSYLYLSLGHAYEMVENYDEAIKSYQRALEIDDKISAVYSNIAKIFAKVGNFSQALDYYEQALEYVNNKSEKAEIYTSMASIYSNSNERIEYKEKIIELLNKAIELNPNSSLIYSNLGKEYYLRLSEEEEKDNFLDNILKTEEYFNKVLELNPNETNAYEWYGLVLINLKKYEEAFIIFNTGLIAVDKDLRIFGEEKDDYKARFYLYKGIITLNIDDLEKVNIDESLIYIKKALDLRENLSNFIKEKLVTKNEEEGYFDKIKDNLEFKNLIN